MSSVGNMTRHVPAGRFLEQLSLVTSAWPALVMRLEQM